MLPMDHAVIKWWQRTILVLQKLKDHFYSSRFFYVSLHGSMANPPFYHGALQGCHSLPCQSTSTYYPLNTPCQPGDKKISNACLRFHNTCLFPTPTKPTKCNPITAMNKLFCIMLKDKPSLVLCTPSNDKQIILDSMLLPTGKTNFQKFFNISTTQIKK